MENWDEDEHYNINRMPQGAGPQFVSAFHTVLGRGLVTGTFVFFFVVDIII